MEITEIKNIVNSDLPDQYKERALLKVLAKDDDIIPNMLEILKIERETKKDLLTDINLELSRAHLYIERADVKKDDKQFSKSFVLDEIASFYVKYKGRISHCFNRFN
jgi:hypothetical protein|tara:strand:- start:70250 stop:70570 length:321 start_codon:yes stop_codon:yes gene_type:complete